MQYTRTAQHAVELPDVALVVQPGDTVELPDDFFVDVEQAAGCGFAPVTTKTTKSTPSTQE